ncbi:MAG: fumarylacetoacetate hydrolase family protein [Peptostreptococcaceae bacterium]
MRFVTFLDGDNEQIGIIDSLMKKIYDLNDMNLSKEYCDMNDFIQNHNKEDIKSIKELLNNDKELGKINCCDINNTKLCAPIVYPIKDVLCLGLNYKDHVEETARSFDEAIKLPEFPVYFSKRTNKAIGPNEKISNWKGISNQVDYEVELGIIIGKEGINISKEDAYDYVFGYTVINDISARDLQQKHGQWFRGKSIDSFTSLGPCIVYKDEIETPVELNVYSFVNGELRQSSNTKNFIFDIPTIINDLSQGVTLKQGDIIATGTPAGVGMGFESPKYLKSGDIVECKIDKIGVLKNIVE